MAAVPQLLTSYSKDILDNVSKISLTPNASVEVEARFHDLLATGGERRGVPQRVFERVKANLNAASFVTGRRELHSTDYYMDEGRGGRLRKTLQAVPGGALYQAVTIIKKEEWMRDLPDYPIRIAVSTETKVPDQSGIAVSPESFRVTASLIRDKHRWQYDVYAGAIRIDATETIQEEKATPGKLQKPNTRWEIEVEINTIITPVAIEQLNFIVALVLRLIYDTHQLYTLEERAAVINMYNTTLGLAGSMLNNDALIQPRNLKRRDCVWGGLIGGKTTYAVTPKAKGSRKQLVFAENGLWLVFPPLELNLLARGKLGGYGVILDGELIPMAARRNEGLKIKAPYYYLPFDVMAYSSAEARKNMHYLPILVQREHLFERLAKRDEICNIFINNPLITMGHPPYKLFTRLGNSVSSLERVLTAVRDGFEALPYEIDANSVMFTPIEAPYIPISDDGKTRVDHRLLRDRRLTAFPDTCKLKDWEELTIDVKLEWGSDAKSQGKLYVNRTIFGDFGRRSTALAEWKGSDFNPLDLATQIDWESLKDVPSSVIVELGPKRRGDLIVLSLAQLRLNKTQPNGEDIANDVWDDINNPLSFDTLLGKTLALVFQAHNQDKRMLFNTIPRGADLVNIGAGAGGDLSKERHLRRTVEVEPNPTNIAEMKRRAAIKMGPGTPMADKIRIEQCGGEDSRRIVVAAIEHFGWKARNDPLWTRPPPLYVSMMLSLSFFWKDLVPGDNPAPGSMMEGLSATLQGLRAAYKAAGGEGEVRFIFMTIEGGATEALIKRLGTNFVLGPAHFRYEPPNKLHVHIEDSIVTDQEEYLVRLPDLERAANLRNMVIQPANNEPFLSEIGQLYTSMYVTGTAIIADPRLPTKVIPSSAGKRVPSKPKMVVAPPPVIVQMATVSPIITELAPLPVDPSKVGAGLNAELPGVSLTAKGDNIIEFLTTVILPDETTPIKLPVFATPTRYYRVATLHDGNSFFHSILKVTRPQYNRVRATEQMAEGKKMRADLTRLLAVANKGNYATEADALALIYGGVDPRTAMPPGSIGAKLPLNTYYYTLGKGALHHTMAGAPGAVKGYDYLMAQMTSGAEMPAAIFGYITEIIYVNINIYKLTDHGLILVGAHISNPPRVMLANGPMTWGRPSICLLESNVGSYEPIGYRATDSTYDDALAFNFVSTSRTYGETLA